MLAVAPGMASAHHLNPFGDIVVEADRDAEVSDRVFVPVGGGHGDVSVLRQGGNVVFGLEAFGDVVIGREAPGHGVFVARGGGHGDVLVDEILSNETLPEAAAARRATGTANSCYQGACADVTFVEAGIDAGETFGGGAHSYGPQQAIRTGALDTTGVVIAGSFIF